jgi:transmembrane sensor
VRSEATAPTLAPPVLSAGERVLIPVTAAPMTPVAVTPADLERALTWQSTQLVFERTPLDQVIAAFNSFNRTRLVVGDPSLRTRRLGGTFRADNMDAFVRLLESGFEIVAEQRGENEIVLRAAK